MRLLERVKDFILQNKHKNIFVFKSSDIPVSIKNYLVKESMLYSPIRGIYILKKSNVYNSESVFKHKLSVISKLWWILSGTTSLAYYKGNFQELIQYKIITKSKNFITYIGEWKKIEVVFTASSIPRITQTIQINNDTFEIETLLSVVINDFKIINNDKEIKQLLFQCDINEENIDDLIKNWFKLSWISKLAVFYQEEGFNDKYNIIKKTLDKHGKRLDTRWTWWIKKQQTKIIKKEKIDLNSLL